MVQTTEGTEYFNQELPVNKKGLQYTAFVDSSAAKVTFQIVSKKTVESMYV